MNNNDNVAEFTTWDLWDAEQDRIFKGTVEPNSWRYCECLPFTTNCHKEAATTTTAASGVPALAKTNYLAENFYNNLGRYYWNTYKDQGGIDFAFSDLSSLF